VVIFDAFFLRHPVSTRVFSRGEKEKIAGGAARQARRCGVSSVDASFVSSRNCFLHEHLYD